MTGPADRPLSILIAAIGGEGGGLLSKWVLDIAQSEGYLVQGTSIPGVAQRTGATTYYIEMSPRSDDSPAAIEPIMALTPGPADVDILLASELMEAGRMIAAGYLAPGRSTMICSSHRIYSITEKSAMADGRADVSGIEDAARELARRLVIFDMAELARETGSVINAVLLGALAGSGALPFGRPAYEDAIRAGGIAVEANLAGFGAGFDTATGVKRDPPAAPEPESQPLPVALAQRIAADYPPAAHDILLAGITKLTDFQDPRYAALYLDRLEPIRDIDRRNGAGDLALLRETGRYLALWMAFEDVIRVADLKTRSARFKRVRDEVGARPGQIVRIVEFLKPRVEEMCSLLPGWLARPIMGSPRLTRMLGRLTKGRHVRTTSLSGFLMLWLLARMRRFRRGTYRFAVEQERIEGWLELVTTRAARDYPLAVEIAECARLIKGYGETHKHGLDSYAKIVSALDGLGADGARTVRELRDAALADEDGIAFAAALEAAQ